MTTDSKYTILSSRLNKFTITIIVLWTVAAAGSLTGNVVENWGYMLSNALIQARHAFNKDIVYRRWAASHGGVYVPVTEKTPPNPN